MFSASFTSATNLIFPPQRLEVSTSIFIHLRINSCHGRYRQRCVSGFADSSSFGLFYGCHDPKAGAVRSLYSS
jgi:hypothetical protein